MSQERIDFLSAKLKELEQKQYKFLSEIEEIKLELQAIRDTYTLANAAQQTSPAENEQEKAVAELTEAELAEELAQWQNETPSVPITKKLTNTEHANKPPRKKIETTLFKDNFEKFLGENLINKIGIAIVILGVSVGVKYAIDHELISPLGRIIMAYLFGTGVFAVAMYLKKNYESFSAVLLSGAMAMFYFITYGAYDFYNLIPIGPTFGIMLFFTIFTVMAALNYNQQVIAHIGLVGAYSVPFLLSTGSGRVDILFSYMLLINLGILAVAIRRYWKSLYYASFLITWVIYHSWWADRYNMEQHFALALGFSFAFYLVFYIAFLANKFISHEKYSVVDIILLLSNSFLYFAAGYLLLNTHPTGKQYLGLFTLANAIVHFAVSLLLFYRKQADRNLFYLAIGLVLIFVTIATPVQLDGNYVTVIWAFEALLLFWIGRKQHIKFYENISFVLMLLAFISILQDWSAYDTTANRPLLNISFYSSLMVAGAFLGINYFNLKFPALSERRNSFTSKMLVNNSAAILIIIAYTTFFLEIDCYFSHWYQSSKLEIATDYTYCEYDRTIRDLESIWLFNYSLFFVALLAFVNRIWIKDAKLARLNYLSTGFVTLLFLTAGLYQLGELRSAYLYGSEFYTYTINLVLVRYISFALLAALLYISLRVQPLLNKPLPKISDAFLHITVLWLLSNEVVNQMQLSSAEHSYKLEITILWGVYALFLIVLGIWKKRKHIRLGAMILFGITLVKLFVYDISHLESIAKTVVIISLGIILLVISFLYNKFKDKITDDDPDIPQQE